MNVFSNPVPNLYYYGYGLYRELVTGAWQLVRDGLHGAETTWQARFRKLAEVYDDLHRTGLRRCGRDFARCFGLAVPRRFGPPLTAAEPAVHAGALLALSEICRSDTSPGAYARSVLREGLPEGRALIHLLRDVAWHWGLQEGFGPFTQRGTCWWLEMKPCRDRAEVATAIVKTMGADFDALPDEDIRAYGSVLEVPVAGNWPDLACAGLAVVEGRLVLAAEARDPAYLAADDVRAWRVVVLEAHPVRCDAGPSWRPRKRCGYVCAQAGRYVYGDDLRAALRRLRQRFRRDVVREVLAA